MLSTNLGVEYAKTSQIFNMDEYGNKQQWTVSKLWSYLSNILIWKLLDCSFTECHSQTNDKFLLLVSKIIGNSGFEYTVEGFLLLIYCCLIFVEQNLLWQDGVLIGKVPLLCMSRQVGAHLSALVLLHKRSYWQFEHIHISLTLCCFLL